LVKELRDNGALVKRFKKEVLNSNIASEETIGKAQKMLEGVCENGTGTSLQNEFFKIAGKTGTARVATSSEGYSAGMYLASFTGYFPADDPRYSIIVTFNNPRGGYYGASVAGPVFKEIAEKIFALQIVNEDETEKLPLNKNLPGVKKGNSKDILKVAKTLHLKNVKGKPDSQLANVVIEDSTVILQNKVMPSGKVPDVNGMGASNAVYLLENAGLRVKIQGVGKVKKQSLPAGSNYTPGQTVFLTLS
jgi:cell division protein FtsI (penicillin-binding protein 3)